MPIFSRAWVFQENSLSKRVLHFLNHDVLYECRHSLRSESGFLPRGTLDLFNRIKAWADSSGDGYNSWRKAIGTYYFPLRLTYSSDRLPAMSGLAEAKYREIVSRMSRTQEKPRYLAGLWEPSLPQDLCWRMASEGGTVIREPYYVAPTWSWASLTGESIHFMANQKTFKSSVELIRSSVVLKNPNSKFGEIQEGAFITLKTGLKEMRLICNIQASEAGSGGKESINKTVDEKDLNKRTYNLSFSTDIPGIPQDEFCVFLDKSPEWTFTTANQVDGNSISHPVSCILIGEDSGQLFGLILKEKKPPRVRDRKCNNHFVRIGFFRTRELDSRTEKRVKITKEDVKTRVDKCRDAFAASIVEVYLY